MLILGLLLILAAGGLTVGVVASNTSQTHVEVYGASVATLSTGELFVIGMIAGIVALFGIAMMLGGVRRSGRKRRSLRAERRTKRQQEQELRAENERLTAQLAEREQVDATTAPETGSHTAGERRVIDGEP